MTIPKTTAVSQFEALNTAIAATIKQKFPNLKLVAPFPERFDERELVLPAFLFEVTEVEAAPESNAGSGQAPVSLRFEAHVVFSFKTPDVRVLLPALAGDILVRGVHEERWGVPCEPARTIGAYPDTFREELEQYACWRVEWEQVIDLGDSAWDELPDLPRLKAVLVSENVPYDDPSVKPAVPLPPYLPYQAQDPVAKAIRDNQLLHWLE